MNDVSKLRDKIQKLEKIHQLHILKILMDDDTHYTENANGVFVNMGTLNADVIVKIRKYLEYVYLQEDHLDEGEQEKNKYKDDMEKDNKDKQ